LDSRNGVIVNKEFPAINRGYVLDKSALYPYHLSHGDWLVIGNVLLYFSFPQAAQGQRRPSDRPGPTSTCSINRPFYERCSINRHSTDAAAAKQPVGLAHRGDVQELSEERIHFEIDMCIGCDRCMYACPVPMSSMVSIADLNHATVSEDVGAHVARFTHECIMCGSCVPVCPVDNHRDLLMLTLKQRLGVSWDSEVDMDRIARALPRGWTVPILINRLREHPLFRDAQVVPDRYLLHLFAASKRLTLAPGETVVREGDYGRDLYLILAGRLSLFAMGVDEQEFPLAVLGQGECVGEYGMLTGQPYAATARAQVPSVVLQVPEQVMQRLMELAPTVRQFFDQLNNARSLAAILKRMALFQGVSNANIDMLVQHTQVKQYDRNERLFAEDDQGGRPARETLHILLEGFVKVATGGTGHHKTDERIIAYRQAGDYFVGGLDLLGDGRAVSVTTINRARVAEVPRPLMLALLQRYPEVNQRFTLRLQEYVESAIAVQPDLVAADSQSGTRALPNAAGLHALVSDGVIEGTEVLLIDLDTCIHCNECEEACARRHGHSRMNRKGMVVGNISIATACRQCQDPVCMLCSRAGIARLPNGEVYITESCIGCGICAERCPYGAISIVDVEGKELPAINRGTTWERFNSFFAKGAARKGERTVPMLSTGDHYTVPGPLDISRPRSTTCGGDPAWGAGIEINRDATEEMRKKIAIKCDLCAGYKDQACVEACPTGAAIRVQPTTFFGSTEAILRRLA
jgi:Fe-S-cluster-containing hydrogenase component 2/CRP-like cAMP-binding protein